MYKLTINNTTYTIPKDNIGLLAMSKAMDRGDDLGGVTHFPERAIQYLQSIGIQVEECKES